MRGTSVRPVAFVPRTQSSSKSERASCSSLAGRIPNPQSVPTIKAYAEKRTVGDRRVRTFVQAERCEMRKSLLGALTLAITLTSTVAMACPTGSDDQGRRPVVNNVAFQAN